MNKPATEIYTSGVFEIYNIAVSHSIIKGVSVTILTNFLQYIDTSLSFLQSFYLIAWLFN